MENIELRKIGIGIDLGTTNCCVSIWRNGRAEIVYFDNYNTFPSVVAYTKHDKYIGREAKNQQEINPSNVFYEVKRLIGRKFDDPTVHLDNDLLSYEIVAGENGNILLKSSFDRTFTPEEISGTILTELKLGIEEYLGERICDVVITIPAYFNDSQREATKIAAKIAGLNCIRIINEPTAAALAYGLEKRSFIENNEYNILVCDIGGGTTDISIVNIYNGVFSVLSSAGNSRLGGADFDNEIIRYIIEQFMETNNLETIPELYPMTLQKLRLAAERSKKLLSTKEQTSIAIQDFHEGKDLYVTLSRDKLNELCSSLLLLCMSCIENALESSDLQKNEINEIIMVGGATRMPLIRDKIETYFGQKPNITVNPDEVVAIGASIQAYIIQNKQDAFSQGITLLDITPLSLGVELADNTMDVIIPRNTNIPTKVTKMYTNDTDYDKSIMIKVFEGERMLVKDNFFIGEFILYNIETGPKGTAVIEITFYVDINGIITVTAEDKKGDSVKSIKVTGNKNKLSEDKINILVQEAHDLETIDRHQREIKKFNYKLNDLIKTLNHSLDQDDNNTIPTHKMIAAKQTITDFTEILNTKHMFDITKKEYMDMINDINSKYETLILNSTTIEIDNKKLEMREKVNATTIYNDDDEDDDDGVIHNKLTNTDKRGAYESRDILTEECHELFSLIDSNSFKDIKEDDKEQLRSYLNDLFMWIYVKTNIRKEDYDNKLKELHAKCDDIFEKNKKVTSDQIINMCNSIMNFMNNVEENDNELLDLVTNTIYNIKNNIEFDIDVYYESIQTKFNIYYDKCMSNNKGTSIDALKQKIK